jgi:hypothetical protein
VKWVIRSPYMRHTLKLVIKEHPWANMETNSITLPDPPKVLLHYRAENLRYDSDLLYDSDQFDHSVLLLQHIRDLSPIYKLQQPYRLRTNPAQT